MLSFSYDSDQAWYIIWKVKTRNKGMNVKNTLCITLSYFIGEFTPQLFYQNYLPISACFIETS